MSFSNTYSFTCRMQSEEIVVQHYWPCVELKTSETFLTHPDATFKKSEIPIFCWTHGRTPRNTIHPDLLSLDL